MKEQELRRLVQHAAELHGVSRSEVVNAAIEGRQPGTHPEEEQDGPRHVGLWISLGVAGLVFVAVTIWFMRVVNGSVEAGPVASSLQEARRSAAPTPPGQPIFAGTTISFAYPGVFDAVVQLKDEKAAVEAYTISSKGDTHRTIQAEVRNLPSGQLDDESDFRFRSIHPADYKQSPVKIMGEPAVVMVKQDNTEQTLFWAHLGKVVEMSANSSNPADDLAAYMKVITDSLRWRK